MAHYQMQTTYVTAQPSAPPILVTVDPFRQMHNQWSTGLCNCCDDMGQCCFATFCWFCFLASLAGKIKESPLSCCFVPNFLGVYRMKIRTIFKIQGDACTDCCIGGWCGFCAALQMHNELKYHSGI